MFDWMADPNAWLALTTLTFLEIILGIDNILFLSLVVTRLPKHQQNLARKLGLSGAMVMRIALLASLVWIIKLSHPLFYFSFQWPFIASYADVANIADFFTVSARDIVLFLGGLFLVWKGSLEIKEMFNFDHYEDKKVKKLSFFKAIVEVMLLDIIFSLDSVITAVGLSDHIFIMILAVVISVVIMMFAAKAIGNFVEAHAPIKMLAVLFLVMLGVILILESLHIHVPKGYIYFAMFFSLAVEILNLLRNNKIKK